MNFNYQKICQGFLRDLSPRTKEVLSRRFGLIQGQRETLEAIGRSYGITRERVRQIEADGFSRLKTKQELCQGAFQHLTALLKKSGNLKKEDSLLQLVGEGRFRNHIFFLLTLGEPFEREKESETLHSLWTIDRASLQTAQNLINGLTEKLEKVNRPLSSHHLWGIYQSEIMALLPKALRSPVFFSYLEISKRIRQNPTGLFGLKEWPEITPKGVKDKAYLVFTGENRPLHFTEVASLIDRSGLSNGKKTLARTVHNELIKDPRFILVGRGIYGLRDWGYEQGQVKEVIAKVLKQAGQPLPKEEILAGVLKQRLVKPNTVLLNLNNKNYFLRDSQGRYSVV